MLKFSSLEANMQFDITARLMQGQEYRINQDPRELGVYEDAIAQLVFQLKQHFTLGPKYYLF